MTEGVIKFRCGWTREPLSVDSGLFDPLQSWRTRLRRAGLLGALPDGTGFGNLSVRWPGPSASPTVDPNPTFLITGSQTGGLDGLDPSHLALVTAFSLPENRLACTGLTQASSESLSHGAIYRALPRVGGVIHLHSRALWEAHLGVLPTTDPAFEYGTPALALALEKIARGMDGSGAGAIVMAGHPEGLVYFGASLEAAGSLVLEHAGLRS